MKRRLQLLLFVFILSGIQVFGQQTFDAKKRSATAQAKHTIGPVSLNYKRSNSEKTKPSIGARKQSFQMNGFNPVSVKEYIHDDIKQDPKGQVYFIKSHPTKSSKEKFAKQNLEEICKGYLNEVAPLLKLNNGGEEFKMLTEHVDRLGNRHVKMQQYHKEVKIFGSELIVHFSKENYVTSVNGRNTPTPNLENVTPSLSKENAFKIAYESQDINDNQPFKGKNNPSPLGFGQINTRDFESAELVLLYKEKDHKLVWHLSVFENMIDRWEYFIDANDGTTVDKYYGTCTFHDHSFTDTNTYKKTSLKARPPTTASATDLNGVTRQLNTFLQDGTYFMIDASKPMYNAANSEIPQNAIGAIQTLDLRNEPPVEESSIFFVTSADNTWNDPAAVSAHYNADIAYEYFRNTFNRNSINGQGGTITSIVNVADPDTGGGYDNAFWNGQFMAYGNGNIAFSTPLAASLDVGGHEMSHGVIQNTANLVYQNQSGAMNESFADIFGTMIDRDDWQLGEDVVNPQVFASGALRDMQNPNNGGNGLGDNGWQPKDMTEFYTGTENNGGVHINSGIPNRAYYLYATEIGRDKAEQVYYKALTDYLTANSQFIDLRLAVIQSATDLHGANSPEVQAAETAFDIVGITDGAPTDTDEELPPAVGDNFILSYDVNPSDPNTLYISNTDGTGFIPVSQTQISRKPSVSDDGTLAIFVTQNNTINGVELNRSNPSETEISEEQIWGSIALSKDGNRLAVSFNDESNRIVIIDLISGTNQEFELFNPTTSSDGLSTGEVLYPDAMEWDYTGEFLIYDALNGFTNSSGTALEYWDVGAIKVWDNATSTFGDGSIQKLFANLPEGVSIGNPSFSKTSNNILAFDFYDANVDEYAVLTANIETNDLVEVWRHDKLGFPNYSSTDDSLLFDAFTTEDDEVIAVIGLGADKLSPSGDPSILIPDAIWGIWYTEGEREEGQLSSEKEITDYRFNGLNPAVIATINGTNITATLPQGTNVSNLVATFTLSSGATATVNGTQQQSGVTANDFTNTITYTITAEDGSAQNYNVTITIDTTSAEDTDGDGILNDDDLCPNTPLGTTVDADGCPIFSLPFDNFAIRTMDASCIGNTNGSISITANESFSYTVTLTGGATNAVESFFDSVSFNNLSAGQYTACITVQGQPDYEVCYDLSIDEPEPLGVNSKADVSGKKVTLSLSGGGPYLVSLNGKVTETNQDTLVLNLNDGLNELTVSTNKSCQGLHSELIIVGDQSYVYPNPISGESLSLVLPDLEVSTAKLSIYDASGRVIKNEVLELNNGQGNIKVGNLSEGNYFLKIQTEGKTYSKKLVKR